MGNVFKKGAEGIKDMGSGGAGRAADVQKDQQSRLPKPPPDPIFYSGYVKKQKDADAYDSKIGESRFQGTAPRHF